MANVTYFTDSLFRFYAENGRAIVEPFDSANLKPASVDLRLGSVNYKYSIMNYTLGDAIDDAAFERSSYSRETLGPGQSAFIGVEENIHIPNDCIGFIFPRSSITRLGVSIMPMYINPGYSGRPPLSITNQSKMQIDLIPGRRVAQLLCAKMACDADAPYDELSTSKYVGEDVAPSRLHSDEEVKKAIRAVIEKTLPESFTQKE